MAVGVPVLQMARVRQNYLANIVAAIACFLFEAVWYSVFMKTWLNGTWSRNLSPIITMRATHRYRIS